jgi:uncharacterized protein (DUF849 family)
MIPQKKQTPFVPISVSEIIEDVHRATEKGITIVHLHAREENGEPTCKAEVYGKMIAGIRKFSPDLIICVSLSGRNFGEFEKRSEPLNLTGTEKPDMGSLTLGSMNFMSQASVNSPEMIVRLAEKMKERNILPELEAFDTGMINYAKHLIKKDILATPCYMNILTGNIATAQTNLLHIGNLINDLPQHCAWSLGGLGRFQLEANAIAIAIGGGVRIGLEDNIYFENNILASNEMLLDRIHKIAHQHNRKIMKPQQLRSFLKILPCSI